jgi:hypothetical protein
VLDLESLQFPGGAHYMPENSKVSVPKESYSKLEKGYEEVCTTTGAHGSSAMLA